MENQGYTRCAAVILIRCLNKILLCGSLCCIFKRPGKLYSTRVQEFIAVRWPLTIGKKRNSAEDKLILGENKGHLEARQESLVSGQTYISLISDVFCNPAGKKKAGFIRHIKFASVCSTC